MRSNLLPSTAEFTSKSLLSTVTSSAGIWRVAYDTNLTAPAVYPTSPYPTYPAYPRPPSYPAPTAIDPGVRGGPPGVGEALPNTPGRLIPYFRDGRDRFLEVNTVTGDDLGLGPRFNSNQCASCHSHPAVGGSSPPRNPLLAVATLDGARNIVPWFITFNGPIREPRFKKNPDGSVDGNVHAMFVISGRRDAPGCNIAQFNFLPAGNPMTGQGGNPNIVFRIPTPMFGSGLIEAIPDAEILANMNVDRSFKSAMGVFGRANSILSGNANRNGNDGTITRFGWKAQNKSLLMFAGEAYNVEQGGTNDMFPDEREQDPNCQFNATPENTTHYEATSPIEVLPDIEAFANFMRLLAAPVPAPDTPSIVRGRASFSTTGCAACHTPSLTAAKLVPDNSGAKPGQKVALYSDLLVHNMGVGLADGITQGLAGPDEFRTAPLWGLGKRIFFLHDGRTSNLVEAILAHRSSGSEANTVIDRFSALNPTEQQDLINFLRAL